MSVSVELHVFLRNGKRKLFSKPAGHGDPPVDLKILQQSLLSLKQETNSYLTEIVEQEKQDVVKGSNGKRPTNTNDDEGAEDDDDDEDKDKDIKPEKKKQKR